jgi:16S rRNA C967 or C1407 C5-methylase (RsmB/RsmF family)
MKDFLKGSPVHTPWTPEENEELLRDFLTISPRWKLLSKRWEVDTLGQPKNNRVLPVPQLFLLSSEAGEELNGKEIMT